MPASPARQIANTVVRRVFEDGAYADQALHAEARKLDPRDRAFARQLAYGTVQRRRALDHVIQRHTANKKLDPRIRAALQLGLYQLLFLDGVPARAAVGESVELVKRHPGMGLVNAVLRKAADEGPAVFDGVPVEVRESYPGWLAKLWREAYGDETATALMVRMNEPAELALRANTLRTTPERLASALGDAARVADDPEAPDAVIVDGAFDAHGHPLFADGHFMPQSRSSQRIARLAGPQPGERVLDLCAAPGNKSSHLAALMGDEGEIVSVEHHAGRAQQLRENLDRMGASIVRVEEGDAGAPRPAGEPLFDRVLADPPCSGLGTLQNRPDLRWRMNPQRIEGLVAEQRRILEAAAAAVKPGGTLVWSTCTLDPAENEQLLDGLGDFERETQLTLFPHETRSAGFQVARLRRRAGQ
ncbi:MAG TPA: 16S rRNA (cytosine(967)-C(5))-methyltransferase RsmB [Solirubrobacteraceae bacterium]|nr:16S rRNA (cytosine(967)-C(5))-methyltransferase RsmB [Solirubrobacteraceae bacterium]